MATKKPSATSSATFRRYMPWIILGLILAVAVFLRFYRLDTLPPGLHPDEAANGLDIFRILQHHDLRIVYATNGPREALFFYIQAIFVAILGNTILALRVAPAAIGVLAVFVTYLWAKDWFGRRVGLLAAAVFAINVWGITVTRDSFRASMTPLMVALVMYFGGKAFKSGRRIWFVLTGLVLGLGCYTYTAFDSLLAALAVIGLFIGIFRRDLIRKNLANIGISVGIFAIIFAPLGVYTVRHPNESPLARTSGTSFLNKGLNGGNPLKTLYIDASKTLLEFNIHGDENARQNTPGEPMLDAFVGIMFLLGLIISIAHLQRPKYFAVLAAFGAMLIPGILSAEGIPHGLRTLGALPAACILAALGINYILKGWYKTFPINSPARLVGLYLIIILLALSTVKSYKQYFIAYAQDPRTYEAYSEDAVSAARYLNSHKEAGVTNYVDGSTYTQKTIQYLTHDKTEYTSLDFKSLEALPIKGGKKMIIVMNQGNNEANKQTIAVLTAKFPKGKLTQVSSPLDGRWLYYVYTTSG